ncbi:SRPBCC family protein [Streptomyces sp. NPDC059443]|uniref:SRPBCC family protein n=1 Tax=unclassified Streptomyces TaxID=2593676 RepID=UPI00368B2F3A
MTHAVDPVGRLRIMAAAIPGAEVVEATLPAPFESVWAVMSDLEGEFGRFQPDMRTVRVLRMTGDRVEALARSKYGLRAHFRGVLRPGWCWLQSRFLIIGMAATPEPGGGTRIALTGGVRVPGRGAIVPFGAKSELEQAASRLKERLS